jgi:hypothetical protein
VVERRQQNLAFGSCMTFPSPQERIYTHNTCLASTTLPTHHREESSDPPAEFFPLSPSLMLSSPTFVTRQMLQLGLWAITHHPPNTTSNDGMQDTTPFSAYSSRESARKSAPPQLPGTMPNRLQVTLARNRAERP